jgi:hypothetical protein
MNFGQALENLKSGRAVRRDGWNGKGMSLRLHVPQGGEKMTLPFIYMITPNVQEGHVHYVPWLASQTDILAEDWR